MRTGEFVMRGRTGSGNTEILNFSGFKPGYAYKLVQFQLYPTTNIGNAHYELFGSITAEKTASDPIDPDFSNEGLIGVASAVLSANIDSSIPYQVINDTFLITQNLILKVIDTQSGAAVNWQCKFVPVKMSGSEEAVANYKQFTISDD